MTIASLLSKLNNRAPRFVTIKGQVIGDTGVVKVGSEFRHPEHGSVTAIQKHVFHDDQDDAISNLDGEISGIDEKSWWVSDPASLNNEQINMARSFPDFVQIDNNGRVAWSGVIDTGRGKFTIVVTHRNDHGLPSIDVVSPKTLGRAAGKKFVKPPHLYTSGKICVAAKEDWNPSTNDAVTVVAWAAHWLAAYTEWRFSMRWPVSGLDVDVA